MFGYTSGICPFCLHCLQPFCTVIWFKGLYQRFKSWFIVELHKEILLVFSLFLKMLETCFFRLSFNFQCQVAKCQKSFMSKFVSLNIFGLKLIKLDCINIELDHDTIKLEISLMEPVACLLLMSSFVLDSRW